MADFGRPPKYDTGTFPDIARKLTGEGATLADLAQAFAVARSTIQDWMIEHPHFGVAVRMGREDATDKVERALFSRATGYEHKVEKPMVADGQIVVQEYQERLAPDVGAARFWLANRRANVWREADRQAAAEAANALKQAVLVEGLTITAPPEEKK